MSARARVVFLYPIFMTCYDPSLAHRRGQRPTARHRSLFYIPFSPYITYNFLYILSLAEYSCLNKRGARRGVNYRRDWMSIGRRRVFGERRVFMGGRASSFSKQGSGKRHWDSARLLSMEDRRMPGQSHAWNPARTGSGANRASTVPRHSVWNACRSRRLCRCARCAYL